MTTTEKTIITVQAIVSAPADKVWKYWTEPTHIMQWNNASDDWHTPSANNDLRKGGAFTFHMAAKDGSAAFDFSGEYNDVQLHQKITYTLADGRRVTVLFQSNGKETTVVENFEAESINSPELQKQGWQSILNNFKKYLEATTWYDSLHFEINIEAKVEDVYKKMLDEKDYSGWTSVFNPTSRYKGTWEEGSKMLFIGTDKDGNEMGMVSRIKENIPNKFVSIEHIGLYNKGEEITAGPGVDSWAGALENYTFNANKGKTVLTIDMDTNAEYKTYFSETWPKALQKLKEICEK